MQYIADTNNTRIVLNPNNHYDDQNEIEIFRQACGLLLPWLESDSNKNLMERINQNYDYGTGFKERPEVEIHEDLAYKYPEDPLLYPYLYAVSGEQELLIYPHAMVVYRENNKAEWQHQRCD